MVTTGQPPKYRENLLASAAHPTVVNNDAHERNSGFDYQDCFGKPLIRGIATAVQLS